ncbi:hypothetical protein SAMN05428947_11823 [Mucilaginibacter sp. OK283]|jgi:hypothetical protein|nr:hypothetical protein SAMN05428947_11823 [Mucilaginibacter sp. OK283]
MNCDELFSVEVSQSIAGLKTLTNLFISQKMLWLLPMKRRCTPNAPPAYNNLTLRYQSSTSRYSKP